jgi:uncharacterized UBP type Zn finger protein
MSAELRASCPSVVYELHSAVLHHGVTATGGHYTAMCVDSFGQWRHMDDVKTIPVTVGEALSHTNSVYILLYSYHSKNSLTSLL